jgi:RNA polymerase sigma factor (sigma-70 family)
MKTSDASLSDLMRRAQDGDQIAYRSVLTACERWLRRYFHNRIAPGDIDDLVQETMIAVHRKRATFDPSREFIPWLAAIARYRWIDRLRQTYRTAAGELDHDIPVESHEADIGARLGVDRLLQSLPPGQASAIRLVKIDGLSVAEASARTGQSEALIKVNIHRGIKRMAALVESE